MGCFLGCFGASKEEKRRKNRNVGYQYQYYQPNESIRPAVAAKVETPDKPLCVAPESQFRVEPEEKQLSSIKQSKPEEKQLSSRSHKKVTFDSNVKEYEPISVDDAPEIIEESEKEFGKENPQETSKTSSKSLSVSDGGSTLSSLGSFPPNHRYQNCRESDDEEDELDCELSDVDKDEDVLSEDDDDDDDDDLQDDEYSDDDDMQEFSAGSCSSMESRTRLATPDSETKTPEFNRGAARDRAGYVHSVLNPVENTTQWKVVKAKRTPPLKHHQKENVPTDSSRPKSNNHEVAVAVDASLANWLGSSEKTPPAKKTTIGLEPIASGGGASASSSHGSNSVKSRDERPILGAFYAGRSPDAETPRVEGDSGSASSFKGIPNTTSKYREDKRVNWHSTPFETRLERALNKGAGRGSS